MREAEQVEEMLLREGLKRELINSPSFPGALPSRPRRLFLFHSSSSLRVSPLLTCLPLFLFIDPCQTVYTHHGHRGSLFALVLSSSQPPPSLNLPSNTMLSFRRFLLLLPSLLLFAPSLVVSLGQKRIVSFNCTDVDAFPLVSSGHAVSILVSKDDFSGVQRAAKTFAGDISNVTSQNPDVLNDLPSAAFNSTGSLVVVVGSVGSPFVSALVQAGAMNVSDIEGRWESFKIQIVDGSSIGVEKALVIVGSE